MWADILKFAEYAFNKSHSAAYGLITMQTAYLKAHYPLEYMAAVLTSYTGKTDKIVNYVAECNRAGIQVLPPDVNTSGRDFTAVTGEGIRFGLAGIRGVGEGVVDTIIAARDEGGPFTSLHDFCARVDMKQLNKKTLEALIKAGRVRLDRLHAQAPMLSMMDSCVDAAIKRQKDVDSGQVSMFDMFAAEDHGFAEEVAPPNGDEWDKKMKLAFEKEMLGIYVSDHPLREIADVGAQAADYSLGESTSSRTARRGWFAGHSRERRSQAHQEGHDDGDRHPRGPRRAIEAVMFPQATTSYRDIVVEDAVVRVKAQGRGLGPRQEAHGPAVEPFDGEAFSEPPGRIIVRTDGGALHQRPRATAQEDRCSTIPGGRRRAARVGRGAAASTMECTMPERVERGRQRPARRADRALRRARRSENAA